MMVAPGIKTKIAFVVALLLLVGMALLDLVVTAAVQRRMIQFQVEKGRLAAGVLAGHLSNETVADNAVNPAGPLFSLLSDNTDILGAAGVDAQGRYRCFFRQTSEPAGVLADALQRAGVGGRRGVSFHGDTWGVFWRQNKWVVVVQPTGAAKWPAVGVAVSLEPVYGSLRTVQKVVAWYLGINIFLLTAIGLYRIHRLALRPMWKMIGRAEAYRTGDAAFPLEEGEDNALVRLSHALNRILELNREDREALGQTVGCLEQTMADLKQAQQEVIRAEKLASVGRLASGIAHEIGNPIGIVIGYLELLKHADLDAREREDYIRRAETEISRIRSIIRQLLDYAKPSGRGPASASVSVHALIRECVDMVRLQPVFSEVCVETVFGAGIDTVWGNADQLRQLFLNFILNAADAIHMAPEKAAGRLRIESENNTACGIDGVSTGRVVDIRFVDNGVGIAEKDLKKIFDPFFTTKPPGMGSGLGLWVSLLIAEAMGGSINISSEPGRGASVRLRLPVVEPGAAAGPVGGAN